MMIPVFFNGVATEKYTVEKTTAESEKKSERPIEEEFTLTYNAVWAFAAIHNAVKHQTPYTSNYTSSNFRTIHLPPPQLLG